MQPSNDERTLAALAHASIVLNSAGLVGLLAAAVIWATQRERSAYVRGHALQALVYQGVVLVISLVLVLSWSACMVLSLLPIAVRPDLYSDGSVPGPFWLALSGMIVPVTIGILATVGGLFGAIQTYRGQAFFYPLVGRLAVDDLRAPATPALAAAPAAETPAPAPAPQPAEE